MRRKSGKAWAEVERAGGESKRRFRDCALAEEEQAARHAFVACRPDFVLRVPLAVRLFHRPVFDDGSNRDVDAGMRKLNVERQERMQEGGSLSAEEYDAVNRRMGGGTLGRPATIEELEARVQADKEKGGR